QRGTYHVLGVRHLQCVQDLEQGRLGQGHRVVLLRKFLGGFLRSLTRWPLNIREPDGTYTTTGDVTSPAGVLSAVAVLGRTPAARTPHTASRSRDVPHSWAGR